jgi:soluble lytic murein transglycosylase-like protein
MSLKKYILASAMLALTLTGCDSGIGMAPLTTGYQTNGNSSGYLNFIVNHSYRLDQNSVNNIADNVTYYSNINGIDPKLVLALMARESSFRTDAVSPAGAIGLGQLMPPTAKDMGVSDPFNLQENVKGTTKYLSWLSKRSNGNIDRILASYNMGPGAVDIYLKNGKALPSSVQKYVSDIKSFYSTI